jgi:dienelactone hydrolase
LFILATAARSLAAQEVLQGHWTGGFLLDGKWVAVNVRFGATNDASAGTADLLFPSYGGGENVVNVALGNMAQGPGGGVHFEIPARAGRVVFDGEQDGETISGSFAYGDAKGTFGMTRWAHVPVEALEKYYGAYHVGPDHVISILRGWGHPRTLNYVDYHTGQVGTLWPSSETEFYSGVGLSVSYPVALRVSFDRDAAGNVNGLTWQAQDEAEVTARRIEFSEERITARNGDITLGGTLILPEGQGPHPVVIVTPGDFGTHRNQLRLWAHHYASVGVAGFIFDSRGAGESTGPVQSSSFSELADDVLACVQALKARDDVDPCRIGLFGFSNSAWTVSLAASRSTDVSFLILQSFSGVEPWKADLFRAETQLRVDGFPEEVVRRGAEFVRHKFEVARTGEGWEQLQAAAQAAAGEQWLPYANFSRSLDRLRHIYAAAMSYDPVPALEKLEIPVLALWGEKDTYLPVPQSVRVFERAMAKARNDRYEIRRYPGASHSLLVSETGSPSTGGTETHYVAGFWDMQADWLRKHAGAQ